MGCLYWILIGWWLYPLQCFLKIMFLLIRSIGKIYARILIFLIAMVIFIAISGISVAVLLPIFVILFLIILPLFNHKYNNADFDSMSGLEFENFCAETLRRNGFRNVMVTKASGDHGADILASKDGLRYAIQCKRYNKNVGNKAVQEAYSGKTIYKADIAVVMTNVYFTEQAKSEAKILNVQLWNRKKLQSMVFLAKQRTGKFNGNAGEYEDESEQYEEYY